MRTIFKKGDTVLISPEVTHQIDWIEGTIIEIEDNPLCRDCFVCTNQRW